MKYIINNKDYTNEVNSLTNFSQKRLGFAKTPKILFDDDIPNSEKTLGRTGYYNPDSSEIHIYATGRHIKDILRSLAHEFVHHMQNENGDLNHDGYMGQGYAQKNPKMREMERQAYEVGNLCFRDWEDSLKQNEPTIYNERRNYNMSLNEWKNKELNKLLLEKFNITEKEAIEELTLVPSSPKAGKQKLIDPEKEDEDNDIENKEKADLDDDGKLSGYEKKRAKAIEKSMKDSNKKDDDKGDDEEDSSKKALQEHVEKGIKKALSKYNAIIENYKKKNKK